MAKILKMKKRFRSDADLIDALISSADEKIAAGEIKLSAGDLIRLLQIKRELDVERPKELKVTWIEPPKTGPDSAA